MGGLLNPLPGFAALVMGLILWKNDDLRHPWLVAVCLAAGIGMQYFGDSYSLTWIAGLLLNVLNAIALLFRWKLSAL